MKKKAQVHLISTKKEAHLFIYIPSQTLVLGQLNTTHEKRELMYKEPTTINQHLYFTTDEEIKTGDWCILFDSFGKIFSKDVQQFTGAEGQFINDGLRKVVATTNSELWSKKEYLYTYIDEKFGEQDSFKETVGIPKISDDFIQSYIISYNKGIKIKEVMIEYKADLSNVPYSSNKQIHALKALKESSNIGCIIRIDLDGTCITSPVETKMYTRGEIESMFINYLDTDYVHTHKSIGEAIDLFKGWFNEKLSRIKY